MRKGERGFALVEAITALAVSAIAAASLMTALRSVGARSAEMEARSTALRQAKALLAEALATENVMQVPRRGDLQQPALSWTIDIGDPDRVWPGIQQVNVEVNWSAAGRKGVTRLAGYRLTPPPT